MKTFSQKPADVTRSWYVLDASEITLGRLATAAARLLIGKDKATFSPHVDGGDYVIVINTDNLKVTGQKMTDKMYRRHSGYPGGLKEKQLKDVIESDSTRAVFEAVRGMLPVNKLRSGRLLRLKLYTGSDHNHEAQKPTVVSLTAEKGGSK